MEVLRTIRTFKGVSPQNDNNRADWGTFNIPIDEKKYPWWSDRNTLIKDSLGEPINDRPLNLLLSSQDGRKFLNESKHKFIIKDGAGKTVYKAIFNVDDLDFSVTKNKFKNQNFRDQAEGKDFFVMVVTK